jgi:hypothetical protein
MIIADAICPDNANESTKSLKAKITDIDIGLKDSTVSA